ncbi:MAG: FAD-binding oxidoreductase [Silicimonas sp.]|nr:FAD-binding oxidoreductase [Silicimonas sp.]
MTFDLTIRGAGIFGLSIAWEAVSRGAKVQIIDPIGAGTGASGGVVGALQPHTPDRWNEKKQFQLESLLLAERFWSEVEATSGISSGYKRVGRLQPLMNDRSVALAKERRPDAQARWGNAAIWKVTKDVGVWAPPSPTGLFVHDTLSAILNPRRAMESLSNALSLRGAEIKREGTDQGAVIWATGWQGLRDMSIALGQNIGNGVKGQAALLAHDATGEPQIFADSLHIIAHLDGTVAIGSTSERDFDDPTQTDEHLDALLERVGLVMPILKGAKLLKRWAGVRPRAASRAPLLGPWPDRPGHFVANGGFKIGFGMAPKIAQTMCTLTLDGNDTIPEMFRFHLLKNTPG